MLRINETTEVRIRPTEPTKGLVRVDFIYSNGEETGIARATAFMRLEDRQWTSPPPQELTPEQLDALFETYNSTEKVQSPYRRHMHVNARKRDDGTFDVNLDCEGFEVDALGALFAMLIEFSEGGDQATFLTLPVVRELEDPELMEELDRRLAAVKDGTSQGMPLEDFLAELQARIGNPDDSLESDEAPQEPGSSGVEERDGE